MDTDSWRGLRDAAAGEKTKVSFTPTLIIEADRSAEARLY